MTCTRIDGPTEKHDAYFELVKLHPLHSISSDEELEIAQGVVENLLRRPLDPEEEKYLDALSDLIAHYENKHWPIEDASGAEALEFLMDEHNLTAQDVSEAVGMSKSRISEIRSGKRPISIQAARRFAKLFHVEVAVFIDRE